MNILITGGASGLGEAITKKLAKNGNNTIYFTYNSSEKNALKIKEKFKNTQPVKCNFSDTVELMDLVAKIDHFNIDVLINNAYNGAISPKHFHKITPDKFLTDFINNIIPTITITQAAIKNFRKLKQGKIITILTSYLVNIPPTGLSSYVACKAYLEKLTKIWAGENAKFNIVSNSISPSFMLTGLTEDVDERVVEQMELDHPQQKLLTANEVADTVDFLVRSSPQINGVDILINAGVNLN